MLFAGMARAELRLSDRTRRWRVHDTRNPIAHRRLRTRGQTLTEYALILGLLVIAIVAALLFFSGSLQSVYNSINQSFGDVQPDDGNGGTCCD